MYHIQRYSSFNGRTTSSVVWRLMFDNKIIQECKTKKEAIEWLSIYSN